MAKGLKSQIYDLCFHNEASVSLHAFKIIKNNFSTLEVSNEEVKELCKLVFHQASDITALACSFIETIYFDNQLIHNDLDSTEFTYVVSLDGRKLKGEEEILFYKD